VIEYHVFFKGGEAHEQMQRAWWIQGFVSIRKYVQSILTGGRKMHIKKNLYIYATLTILLMSLLFSATVSAQLVLVNLKVKIVKVQRESSSLQVRVHEGGNKDVQYVELDQNTSFSHGNKSFSYTEALNSFRKDMMIRVKGGYTMAGHVKAKEIYW
jgi:hypothetical protein